MWKLHTLRRNGYVKKNAADRLPKKLQNQVKLGKNVQESIRHVYNISWKTNIKEYPVTNLHILSISHFPLESVYKYEDPQ